MVFYLLLNWIIRFSILVDDVTINCFISSRILSWLLAVREGEGVELVFESVFGPILLCYVKILVDEESYVKGKCCRVFLWFFRSRLSRFSWIFLSIIWRCFSATRPYIAMMNLWGSYLGSYAISVNWFPALATYWVTTRVDTYKK